MKTKFVRPLLLVLLFDLLATHGRRITAYGRASMTANSRPCCPVAATRNA
ncbi:MAG: hypothetical protein ACP5PN_11630 [Steroidobacteraceae bacterium]